MRLNKTLSNRFLNKLDSLIKMFKTKLKYAIINPYHIKKARNTFVLVFLAFKMIILLFPLDDMYFSHVFSTIDIRCHIRVL